MHVLTDQKTAGPEEFPVGFAGLGCSHFPKQGNSTVSAQTLPDSKAQSRSFKQLASATKTTATTLSRQKVPGMVVTASPRAPATPVVGGLPQGELFYVSWGTYAYVKRFYAASSSTDSIPKAFSNAFCT